jgi:hypothetical protein
MHEQAPPYPSSPTSPPKSHPPHPYPEVFVVLPELVPPQRHAVRLVDDEPREAPALAKGGQDVAERAAVDQLLWGDVEQLGGGRG